VTALNGRKKAKKGTKDKFVCKKKQPGGENEGAKEWAAIFAKISPWAREPPRDEN